MKTTLSFVPACFVAVLLSACGGGSGNSPSDTTSYGNTSPVSVSSGNELAVARAAVVSGFAVARIGMGSSGTGFAKPSSMGGVTAGSSAISSVMRAALAQRRMVVLPGSSQTASVNAAPGACADGGTHAATWEDRDKNSVISEGDVVTVVFKRCSAGGVLLDGPVVMTVNIVRSASTVGGSVEFQHLVVSTGTVVSTLAGVANVTETDGPNGTELRIVSGGTLNVALASPSYSDSIIFSGGFTIATTAEASVDLETIDLMGTFSTASLNGSLAVDTLEPILLTSASAYPYAGKLHVTGNRGDGGTLIISVLDSTRVEVQFSPGGDTPYDSGTAVPWTTLMAQ